MRHPATAAVLAAAATVGALMTSGCSSDGAPAASSSRITSASSTLPVPASSTPSAPASSTASSTAVALPQPTSTAKRRATPLTRPAGARQLSSPQCSSTLDDLVGISIDMRIVFDGYARSPEVATQNFKSLPSTLTKERRTIDRVRGYWLAAGYPSSFPTVRDLEAMAAAADRLFAAARAGDAARLPQIYLAYNSALQQYTFDANDSLCPA
jgi:hypothetical protein